MGIVIRIALLVIGYAFGLFQSGYIIGKITKQDLRKSGSGNTGATNALRVMGIKGGIIVFLLDALKAFIPCFAVSMIFRENTYRYVYLMYTAFGVILGNDYPFYLHFKGGKGVAATSGYSLAWCWWAWIIGMSFFFAVAAITGYVSLASCLVTLVIIGLNALFGVLNHFGTAVFIEYMVVVVLMQALLVWRHRANIKRLLNGTENRFGHKKKEEK